MLWPMTDETDKDTTAKDELFEAIDHFKSAAAKLFDKAAGSKPVKRVSETIEDVGKKIDPALTSVADKLDPAFDTAAKEAERVISKIGASAEPLAKQLTGELSKLTKKIGETLDSKKAKKQEEE